jgi:hypothetical protein
VLARLWPSVDSIRAFVDDRRDDVSDSNQPNAKVLFRVPGGDGSADVETLWATDLGDDRYQIDNSPFFAYSVSWQDVVYAPFDDTEGFPTFQRVITKSGNRTVRVLFEEGAEPGNQSDRVVHGLVALGCSYEGANSKFFSITVPPGIDLDAVRHYLIEQNATFEHADPTYDELFT